MIREMILRFPKLRGMGNIEKAKKQCFVVNLDKIDQVFNEGERVNIQSILSKKLIKVPKSLKSFEIKILGSGNLTKKLIFDRSLLFSEKAKNKIIQQGSLIQ
jgi:ribosomal protein L15